MKAHRIGETAGLLLLVMLAGVAIIKAQTPAPALAALRRPLSLFIDSAPIMQKGSRRST